jgi:hypothetical protein
MDKNVLKGIAERKLEHMRHGCFRGGLNHFLDTGSINGSFLDALNELAEEIVKTCNIPPVIKSVCEFCGHEHLMRGKNGVWCEECLKKQTVL